jgi:hypothetical protein
MLPEMREVFEYKLGIGKYWAANGVIELKNPDTGQFQAKNADDVMYGRIILRSAVAKGGLESATAKAAWLDECGQDSFTVETWEAVLRRLSLSRGRVLGTTTPYNLGWLKSDVFDKWQRGSTDFDVIQFASTSNPQFSQEEYERAKASMPKWRFDMFYRGLLSKPAGLVYDCFDDAFHVIDDFELPAHWPRYVGVDFGAVHTALIWVAENPQTGAFYVYRESLSGGKSTDEHAAEALELAKNEHVVSWLGGAPSETQQRMDWGAAGVPVLAPYVSDVLAGIDRPYGLFKTKRLFVFRSCSGLVDELGSYRFKLDPSGNAIEGLIVDKSTYHRLDALRYVASGLAVDGISYGPGIYR